MTSDAENELYFSRNIQWLKDANAPKETWEYEVIADAEVIGEVAYGPYFFTIWELGFHKRDGDERRLCLRVEHRLSARDEGPIPEGKTSAFYHGGGIPDEIVAMASLFLRRRLHLGQVVRMDDMPRMIDLGRGSKWIDDPVVAGTTDLSNLARWFPLVEGLRSEYHQRFILAARLYQQALLMVEDNPEIAYLNLISAIEVVSGDFDIGPTTVADRDSKLAQLVAQIDNDALRGEIEQRIVSLEHFIRRRFKRFILSHVEESFWDLENRPEYGQVEPADLGKFLGRVYDQRSSTLHDGKPFPPFALRAPFQGEEIPLGLSVQQGERIWKPNEYIPLIHFFERLVRHVLINYLQRNQKG